MTKPLQLVITCDDGGLSAGIDTAVIDLYEEGLVSAVSVMSNMPYAKTGLARYKEIPSLEVGAHLNLSEGRPLTSQIAQSAFVKNGMFNGCKALFMRGIMLSDDDAQMIYNELDAQMQIFVEQGMQPAHITTHHHFHMLPKLKAIVYDLAKKYDVRWVRNSSMRGAVVPNNPFIANKRQSQQYSFIVPDYIVLVMEWMKHAPQVLLSKLDQLEGLIELVIHPSTMTDDSFPDDIVYQPQERYQEIVFMREFFDLVNIKFDIISLSRN